MKTFMEDLLALQQLELHAELGEGSRKDNADVLRKKIPGPILAHHDRLRERGKKSVALARHGVCSECHIRIAVGVLGALAFGTDIQVCGNCGRYLYLPEDEPLYREIASAAATGT